jgi:hypothetical protein
MNDTDSTIKVAIALAETRQNRANELMQPRKKNGINSWPTCWKIRKTKFC